MPFYTDAEAGTIREAFRQLSLMVYNTNLTKDLRDALKAARSIPSWRGTPTIREREAAVMGAFLVGFRAPRKITAADMYGLGRWWHVAVMAGARFRVLDHPLMVRNAQEMGTRSKRLLKQATKARRMMRDAVEAHNVARDRHLSGL